MQVTMRLLSGAKFYYACNTRPRFLTSQSLNVIGRSSFCTTLSLNPESSPHANPNYRPPPPAFADVVLLPISLSSKSIPSQEQRNRSAHEPFGETYDVDESCSKTDGVDEPGSKTDGVDEHEPGSETDDDDESSSETEDDDVSCSETVDVDESGGKTDDVEEERKRREHEACSKTKMTELEKALAEIVGMDDLKIQIQNWAKGMLLDEKRRTRGLKVGPRRAPHMAFLGNPGTGKTMVARLLGRLLHTVELLPTDKVTEVQRTDLVGQYVGETGVKTRKKIEEAEGGILFVDEAYQLIKSVSNNPWDYGIEALEEIMSVMESGKVAIIFAGYSESMKRVINSNEGFKRRVTKFFQFNDYTSEDLAKITHIKMNNQQENRSLYGFTLHSSCSIEAIAALIQKETSGKQRRENNAGLVDIMLVNAKEHLDQRLDFDCSDDEELQTITLLDLEAGLKRLTQ